MFLGLTVYQVFLHWLASTILATTVQLIWFWYCMALNPFSLFCTGYIKKRQHLIFMNIRCYKFQFTVVLRTRVYNLPIEYDNNSFQIPWAKRLFYSKTKRIFMNIKCCFFFIHTVCADERNFRFFVDSSVISI